MAGKEAIKKAQSKLRSKFLQVLRSRMEEEEPVSVCIGSIAVVCPVHQNSPQTKEEMEIMESCRKADTEKLEELIEEENMYLIREDWSLPDEYEPSHPLVKRSHLPMVILKLKKSDKQKRRPAVVFLHSMHKNKESMRPLLKAYASRGYIAVAVDSCYHGERATNVNAFRHALVFSWSRGKKMPYIYDPVLDLVKLADYLTQREDIDPSRIGITGILYGGIQALFAALADTRYAVVVPLLGVRGFRWALDNDKWKDECDSVKHFYDVARHNLGKAFVDKEVVEKALERVAPGLTSEFDLPYTIPAIAPRPLLIINGAEDPQCPIASLEVPISKARQAYEEFQCSDNFKFIAEPGVGQELTRFQMKETSDWFDRFLKP